MQTGGDHDSSTEVTSTRYAKNEALGWDRWRDLAEQVKDHLAVNISQAAFDSIVIPG